MFPEPHRQSLCRAEPQTRPVCSPTTRPPGGSYTTEAADFYTTGTADFNHDDKADLWQVSRDGSHPVAYVWLSAGSSFEPYQAWGSGVGGTNDWQTGVADFNRDHQADLWQVSRLQDGSAYVWLSNGSGFEPWQTWGSGVGATFDYRTGVADFDGDGQADLWQVSRWLDGSAYVWLSNGSNFDPWRPWGRNIGSAV